MTFLVCFWAFQNPKGFAAALLEFLSDQHQHLQALENIAYSVTIDSRLKNTVMALDALGNAIVNHQGVEAQCIGHFPLLFSLLAVPVAAVQRAALGVVSIATRNNECVNDIAAADLVGHLLLLLHSLPDSRHDVLATLHALVSTTRIVKEALAKGAVVYLLDLFCNSGDARARESCAELLARMGSDKLVGPRVRLALGSFLPPIFADAMRDNAQACVHMFESAHEHPELIWNQEAKDRVCGSVAKLRKE